VVSLADLKVSLPAELTNDFLSKLPYVAEGLTGCEIASEGRDKVRFRLRPGASLSSEIVAERIVEVAQRMCDSYRPNPVKVLHSRADRPVPFGQDPHPLLQQRAELKCFGAGRFGLGPLPLHLMEFFERRLKQLTSGRTVPERRFPSLIGAETLAKCRYFRSFPHSLALVSHLREDLEAIERFAQNAQWEGDRLEIPEQTLAPVTCVLSPAVCFHHYAWLENTADCPNQSITAMGKCFRYESGNLIGLERLWDFTMREIIWVGAAEHVQEQRSAHIAQCIELLDEWGLNYEIAGASDPFFIDDYSMQVLYQKAFDLKYEIVVQLPYRAKGLAVGSFNYHQDFFGRALNITRHGGDPVHTGCLAFGLERLVLAFLTQYGLEPSGWPEAVRRQW
jgi:hypothetical protein